MYQQEQDLFLYEEDYPEISSEDTPVLSKFMLFAWGMICILGLLLIFGAKQRLFGVSVIAVPTLLVMMLNVNFAFYIFMIILPMFSGIGFGESFTLIKAVGYIFLLSFILNSIMGKIRLSFSGIIGISLGFFVSIIISLVIHDPTNTILKTSFSYFQFAGFFCMSYWLLIMGGDKVLITALKSYLVGVIGMLTTAFFTGGLAKSMQENEAGRLSAGVGEQINANTLAVIIAIGLIISIYLLLKERKVIWKVLLLFCILVFPLNLLLTGSRGTFFALLGTFTMPLVLKLKPRINFKALIAIILLLGISISFIFFALNKINPTENLIQRITDRQNFMAAFDDRMYLNKTALSMASKHPLGTGKVNWFTRSGLALYPHNDFCYNLALYGIPAVLLLLCVWGVLGFKIKKLARSPEKLIARSLWLFFLIIGLKGMYSGTKIYWLFFAIIAAIVDNYQQESVLYYSSAESDYSSTDVDDIASMKDAIV